MYDYFDKSTDPLPFNAEHGYTGVLIWKKDADYGKDVILTAFCNFSFSHSVFKSVLLQSRKNQGLFGKGLIVVQIKIVLYL